MMRNWQIWLLTALAVLILIALVRNQIRKSKERKERDFLRKLETLLREKETVKSICTQKDGRWILTNSRLILEKKGQFQAFGLKEIKSLKGKNAAGNRTTAVRNMVSLTVKTESEYVLQNNCSEFVYFASQLQNVIKKKAEKRS